MKEFQEDEIIPANKIVAKHSLKLIFQEMYAKLKQIPTINVEQLSNCGCDIVNVNSSKGQAILHLIAILNKTTKSEIILDNVLYFGDNYNDYSAFEILSYAIAMEHSPPAILKLDYDFAGSNNAGEFIII
ncbi:HAD family hydrolase [Spiroplasma endosymbiont of Polydrusus formosus]|uniref:HAD family hydrolase n=1 Tax=Spiroplasma endosymbiont of Polydrusus formosus TaxID=3139326 RepID=UPI0035B567A5